MKNSTLPTFDSIEDMTPQQISIFKQCGFCYVRINEKVESNLMEISTAGCKFFNQPESKKQQFAYNNDKAEGYVNRKEKRGVNMQHYAYRGGLLPEPLSSQQAIIDEVTRELEQQIALPVMKKIFEQVGIAEHYISVATNYSPTLGYNYYPCSNIASENNLAPHRDTVLITALFSCEPGLDVYFEDEWHPLSPKQGHAILILGKTLELMTGKECFPPLHRVRPPTDRDRLSVSMYLKLNLDVPLIDYISGKHIYANSEEFFKDQIKVIYPDRSN